MAVSSVRDRAAGRRGRDQYGCDVVVAAVAFVPGQEKRRRSGLVLRAVEDLWHPAREPSIAVSGRTVMHVAAQIGRDEREPCRDVGWIAEWNVLGLALRSDRHVVGGRIVLDGVSVGGGETAVS